ncbi:SDR family oxidoreductase [Noviherbaspirillum sedimenti]|uniref:SDR family oxidoreductase n=1 Tax=Noviherbaspirillum sedimenti TaxID=2320865 RepID=A0A3A3G4D4_9BURK|nr:SDR family oxidoreductase [Noviherbaspirillum sedimenti]RJG03353.1 SDR family oxidoreductase [Noviherbaspirillum sedimenti]
MGKLTGKRALVLGAAAKDNMSQSIARRFAAEGAQVMVAGRKMDELERFAAEIGGHACYCDITKREDNQALAQAAVEKLGGIDIAVNGTGWGLLKPFELTTEEELRHMTDLQFVGPFFFFQAVVPKMSQGGSLIQISSATATIMLENHAAYMGTKAGFDHVIRCLANEYGAQGVRANSISPGLTESPMTAGAKAIPGIFETYQSRYPLGRIGTQDDIAAAAVWLASDECFMSGQNLQINGGLTLRGNPTGAELDAAAIKATGKPRPRPWEK